MRARLLLWFILLWFILVSSLLAFGQGDPAPASTGAPANSAADGSSPAASATPPPDLTPDAKGALSQEQMQALFRVVAEKDRENDKRLRDYTYIEHDVHKNLDGKGRRSPPR